MHTDPYLGPRYALGVDVTDDTPEAPSPSPRLELFMLVTENDVANRGDGGKLLFQEIQRGQNAGYVQENGNGQPRSVIVASNLVLSAAADSFLLQWPWKGKAGKEGRPFRVTVEEITWADVPPDPEAVPPAAVPTPPSVRQLLEAAQVAASRDGDSALAARIATELDELTPALAPSVSP